MVGLPLILLFVNNKNKDISTNLEDVKRLNTINKITIKENKTLKLNNVLIREVSGNELIDMNRIT